MGKGIHHGLTSVSLFLLFSVWKQKARGLLAVGEIRE